MTYQLYYFDEVETDVHLAKTWYKEQKNGLEIEFTLAIENAINHILESPNAYSIRYKKVRIAHPKRFPYNIHFYVDELTKSVVVIAIVHSKRHPNIVKKRV